jgi:hypothetical protein
MRTSATLRVFDIARSHPADYLCVHLTSIREGQVRYILFYYIRLKTSEVWRNQNQSANHL